MDNLKDFDSLPDDALVRFCSVQRVIPWSRTTIWRHENEGTFPKRVRIGSNTVAGRVGDLRRWLAALDRQAA